MSNEEEGNALALALHRSDRAYLTLLMAVQTATLSCDLRDGRAIAGRVVAGLADIGEEALKRIVDAGMVDVVQVYVDYQYGKSRYEEIPWLRRVLGWE
jgi:hypothetical protein